MLGPITNKRWQQWAAKALAEGRLHWRVTDAQGRSCNGGKADPLPLGKWSPAISDARICSRGWHTTSDPLVWAGVRVWLVEGDGLAGQLGDGKKCWTRIRPLAEVDPQQSICCRLKVAAMRSHLCGADLRGMDLRFAILSGVNLNKVNLRGSNLSGANLVGAYLNEANLVDVNLRGAHLIGASLFVADLTGADLSHSLLRRVDLGGANLSGANLKGASFIRSNLTRVNLSGADLTGADLTRVDLSGARLTGANLGQWERGPDGYARRKE